MVKVFSVLLSVVLLLSGCTAAVDMNAPALANETVAATPRSRTAAVTQEQAQEIALAHAGVTADQVDRLHTEYELEDGIPRFEVRFDLGSWEYDYEINAETGEIISYDRDQNS